jgi:hypothetical protein
MSPNNPTTITNLGLQMEAKLVPFPADGSSSMFWAFLSCTPFVGNNFYLILLQRLVEGEQRFIRARPDVLGISGPRDAKRRISVRPSGMVGRSSAESLHMGRLLGMPVEDPKVQLIYVAQTPPVAKFHYPIRLGVQTDVAGMPDCEFTFDLVASYDRDLRLKNVRTSSYDSSEAKGLTAVRFFLDSTTQSATRSGRSILLTICRIKTAIPHFGTTAKPLSIASTSPQALLIGLQDPPRQSRPDALDVLRSLVLIRILAQD